MDGEERWGMILFQGCNFKDRRRSRCLGLELLREAGGSSLLCEFSFVLAFFGGVFSCKLTTFPTSSRALAPLVDESGHSLPLYPTANDQRQHPIFLPSSPSLSPLSPPMSRIPLSRSSDRLRSTFASRERDSEQEESPTVPERMLGSCGVRNRRVWEGEGQGKLNIKKSVSSPDLKSGMIKAPELEGEERRGGESSNLSPTSRIPRMAARSGTSTPSLPVPATTFTSSPKYTSPPVSPSTLIVPLGLCEVITFPRPRLRTPSLPPALYLPNGSAGASNAYPLSVTEGPIPVCGVPSTRRKSKELPPLPPPALSGESELDAEAEEDDMSLSRVKIRNEESRKEREEWSLSTLGRMGIGRERARSRSGSIDRARRRGDQWELEQERERERSKVRGKGKARAAGSEGYLELRLPRRSPIDLRGVNVGGMGTEVEVLGASGSGSGIGNEGSIDRRERTVSEAESRVHFGGVVPAASSSARSRRTSVSTSTTDHAPVIQTSPIYNSRLDLPLPPPPPPDRLVSLSSSSSSSIIHQKHATSTIMSHFQPPPPISSSSRPPPAPSPSPSRIPTLQRPPPRNSSVESLLHSRAQRSLPAPPRPNYAHRAPPPTFTGIGAGRTTTELLLDQEFKSSSGTGTLRKRRVGTELEVAVALALAGEQGKVAHDPTSTPTLGSFGQKDGVHSLASLGGGKEEKRKTEEGGREGEGEAEAESTVLEEKGNNETPGADLEKDFISTSNVGLSKPDSEETMEARVDKRVSSPISVGSEGAHSNFSIGTSGERSMLNLDEEPASFKGLVRRFFFRFYLGGAEPCRG